MERLRAAVEVERLRAELAGLLAERDALQRRVSDLEHDLERERTERDRAASLQRSEHVELRRDAAHWRDVARAREAELRAEREQLRAIQGASFWRRLLGGPVAPVHPELPGWSVEPLDPAEAK